MGRIVFSLIWTVFATLGVAALVWEAEPGEHPDIFWVLFPLFPLVGLWFVWDSLRRYRRYKSVREERTEFGVSFVWEEFDGSQRRSRTNPRDQWDAEDADGDGGGD